MTGLVRKATLLTTAAGLLIASAAMAGVPSPAQSTVPACIKLVGSKANVPDPHGLFTVVVKDLAGNPINNASVVIDISGCTDLRLYSNQLDAGANVNCPAKRTQKFADATGTVTFIVLGESRPGVGVTLQGAGKIFANGTQLGSPTVSAFDLNGGGNGVEITDLSLWLQDFGSPGNPPFGRSDFDCSGSVGINDLSQWLAEFGFTTSIDGGQANCP